MRRARILQEGARYHVVARAHRHEMIFDAEDSRTRFLAVVARAKEKYRFDFENFCLMGNHFHMIVRPRPGTSLSTILQWILSVFARDWNRVHGYTGSGSVWGQRFFSKILATLAEYLHTFLYIDENPVAAGLVNKPDQWPFSACGMRSQGVSWVLDDPPEEVKESIPNHPFSG